ncbi:hypothetical protein F441_11995 [Phytophthora nicotianae CJ01A1]|nr:hypothetical protein L915_11743 [Phytophthora nicotianae]ETL36321.1 hypothetical protein L916_11668 [Phytophthora nicotianae]ETP12632.1 hypothetical protein F441_11995 [Phytophthora nicotianae CJ01A1]
MSSSANDKEMDDRSWIQLYYWAEKTTKQWKKTATLEWKRTKQRQKVASLRQRKIERQQHMQRELEILQNQFKRQLAHLNHTVSASGEYNLCHAVLHLAVESDALRSENSELHKQLQFHQRMLSLAQERLEELNGIQPQDDGAIDVYEQSGKSPWTSRPSSTDSGWHVNFPNGEPSFHFQPFTRDHFDEVIETCVRLLGDCPPYIKLVGTMFGWNMHCAPLTRRLEGGLPVTHARFTTRLNRSFDDINSTMPKLGFNAWPLISTPPNWNRCQRDAVYTEFLQEFEKDAYVMVCNVPGPKHYRFLFLLRRLSWKRRNGKRVSHYMMVIADTKANALNRAAVESQDAVNWVLEGGTFLTFTEVDDKSVDVSYDHWTSCEDERHAQLLFIQWAQFLCRWSERISPSNLLQPEI